MLGCYGGTRIPTPNFDRLAARCVRFDNHHVGSLPCMPARRDLLSGRLNFLHRSWGPLEPFELINGPAGMHLGTGAEDLPNRLPPVDFELGVIAGNQSLNPVYSSVIPGADDGKVSIDSTRVAGMTDHIVLSVTHTFMMMNPVVIAEVMTFLETGRFDPDLSFGAAVEETLGGD
jgi:hypothetical protein